MKKIYFFLSAMLLTLSVNNVWGETATFLANSYGWNDATLTGNPTTKTIDDITFTFADGTTKPTYYDSDGLRTYEKCKITISSEATISSIQFTYIIKNSGSLTASTGTWDSSAQKWSGSTNSVTFTVGHSSGTNNGQVRIKQIVVTYTPTSTPPTPATQYTIKWHTAKGVTTDVTLNEGATITKPETDPTMAGYKFMGWTEDCEVASDGAGFTAIENFGTATEDKDYYAVFAEATTTSGGGSTEYTLVNTISEGTYLIAVDKVNSSKYNFAIGTASNGHAAVEAIGVTKSNTISSVPSGAKEYVLTGDNTNGYSIKCDDEYLVATEAKQSLSYSATCSETWTFKVSGSGFHLTGKTNGSKMSSNSTTAATSIRNYASSGSFYSPLYFFKKSSGSITTYDNYITTCASGIEYIELGDAFKWNATEAEVTIDATDNVFPELTNTHNVPVTYSSSDDAFASIAADGTVTIKKEGTVTITAKYEGGTSAGTGKEYKAKTVTYSLKVNKAAPVASGTTYVKVTSTAGITNGEYLIVYEDETAPVAFDGSLATLDAAKNTVAVGISNSTIAGNTDIDAALFTIDVTAGTLKSASGKYIGVSSNSNGLKTEDVAKDFKNAFSVDDNGNAVIAADFEGSTMSLRYNNVAGDNNLRFRYYKNAGQQPIALYKKASKHTVTIATCTNGSVSASVANGAQVLSGIQITLSNEAATGYKLAAYDVYKTGEESTKVTVTDGKFIMPEFDVTISATFELAKTLTGIEITTPATQTTFWKGETFNHEGLKVTAHFDGADDEDVTDKVTVTGSTATSGAAVEVTVSFTEGSTTKTITYTINVKAIPNTQETAYTVADAFDIIDKLGDTDKMYITGFVSQADLEQSSIEQYKNADYWISADGTTKGQQLEAFRGKYLDNTDFTSVNQIMVGDEVIIYGKLTKYGSTYEFAAGNYLVSLKRDKQQPELSYTTTEYNVNLGDAFTAPTLNNPHSLAITYSSNNEDVATVAVDGAVTIKAAGTVTITASFAGDEDYVAGEASYTINVTDPSISEATFVAGIDKSEELTITKNGITVEFTNGTFDRTDNYRCYGKESMTISYADGNITKIVIECTANDEAEYGPGQFTTETATYSYSGKVGTWTGEANSVTFTNIKQVRMTAITVYYKQDTRTPAGIAWTPATVSLTVGDAFTAPTFSNPNSVTGITFASDNEALATVNNAGVISLVSGKTGTATITATYAGDATYKAAEATCVINVNPVTDEVVILAQHAGKWYAMMAQCPTGQTERLAALPVEYINGTLYNVTEENKALITWTRAFVDDKVTFQNNGKYLKGKSTTTLILEEGETGLYLWDKDAYTMTINGTVRTFLYSNTYNCFRNYGADQASNGVATDVAYSALPVVTAAKFETATIYTRSELLVGNYGTICLPYGSSNFTGAEFYEVAGKETGKVVLDQVTTLEAGIPYIFKATANELKVVYEGEADDASNKNGLYGTFTDNTSVAEGMYIVNNNQLRKCGTGCIINANRAYLNLDEVTNGVPAQMPGRKRVGMAVTGENGTTDLDNIMTPNGKATKVLHNGQIIIIRNGEKFNAQGQKL